MTVEVGQQQRADFMGFQPFLLSNQESSSSHGQGEYRVNRLIGRLPGDQ